MDARVCVGLMCVCVCVYIYRRARANNEVLFLLKAMNHSVATAMSKEKVPLFIKTLIVSKQGPQTYTHTHINCFLL